MRQKVSFLAVWGLFGAFLTPFGALGTQPEFFQKSKNAILLAIWIYNFMQNFRKIQWAVFLKSSGRTDERTDERTGVNS